MPGCLGSAAGTVGGCAGDVPWLPAWAARDGAGPAVVPPSAPSWQLLLNLPFIACQKRPGCFAPPLPFNPDFHHSPGCACPPLRVRHRRVGGQELCRAQPRVQLFPAPGRPSPQMFSGCGVWLPVVGGSLASSGLTPGDVGDAHWSPRWELRWGGLVGQLVRCFLHVGASSCLISVFGNETNHQRASVRGDKAASLPEPPAAGQGPSRGLPPGGPGP